MLVYDILLEDVEVADASFSNDIWLVATVFDDGMAITIANFLSQIFSMNFTVAERNLQDSPVTKFTLADKA